MNLTLLFNLIEGSNLKRFVIDGGFKNISVPAQKRKSILSMFRQIVDGIRVIHKAGIIHSDIKHDNVMIQKDTNKPFIIDLGSGIEANNNVQAQSVFIRELT